MVGAIVLSIVGAATWHAPDVEAVPLLLAAGDEADRLTREGIELRRAGNDEKALELFRRAEGEESSPRLRAQIGLAEQALGRWVAADRDLASALRSKGDAWIIKNRAILERAAKIVADHLGTVMILGSPSGATVLVNGQRVGTLPMAEPYVVAAGEAVITVEAAGHFSIKRKVTVIARGVVRETIELPAEGSALASSGSGAPNSDGLGRSASGAAAADRHSTVSLDARAVERSGAVSNEGAGLPADRATVPAEQGSTSWTWQKSLGAGLLGVAAASLVFGIIETMNRESKANAFKQAGCGTNDLGIGDCRDRYNQVQSSQRWMIAGYIGAAAAGVAGTCFVVLSPTKSPATGDDGTQATAVSGITFNLRGRF